MRNQQSSRSRKLLEIGHLGVKALIRAPVKEAVREALAEERPLAEGQARTARLDETGEAQKGEENENRVLRPSILLLALCVAAAVAVVKRRRLMAFAKEKGVVSRSDEPDSTDGPKRQTTADLEATTVSNRATPADVEATDPESSTGSEGTDSTHTEDATTDASDTKYDTSPDAVDRDTDHNESPDHDDTDRGGPIENGDYHVDADDEGVSTTE